MQNWKTVFYNKDLKISIFQCKILKQEQKYWVYIRTWTITLIEKKPGEIKNKSIGTGPKCTLFLTLWTPEVGIPTLRKLPYAARMRYTVGTVCYRTRQKSVYLRHGV